MHAYEAAMLGRYARTAIAQVSLKSAPSRRGNRAGADALMWLATKADALKMSPDLFEGVAQVEDPDGAVPGRYLSGPKAVKAMANKQAVGQAVMHALNSERTVCSLDAADEPDVEVNPQRARKALRRWLREPLPPLPARISPLERRLRSVVDALGLDQVAGDVLGLLARLNTVGGVFELAQGVFSSDWEVTFDHGCRVDMRWGDVGKMLGLSAAGLMHVRGGDSPLRRLGLVSQCNQDAELQTAILNYAQQDHKAGKVPVMTALMGRKCRASEADTIWSDFGHLGPARDMALDLVKGAMKGQTKGVVILLHGPPGTGKTAFAQTLIAHAGAKGWMVGETDRGGEEANRDSRLSSLLLASALSAGGKGNVLVLDEADDVFNDGAANFMTMFAASKSRHGSKVFMNRALEDLAAPTIMIVNDARNLGDAVVRRMSLAIEIKTPRPEQAAKIAGRVLTRQKLKVSPQAILDLAHSGTPPAVMALAARAASVSGGGEKHLKLAARSVTRMLDIETKSLTSDLAGMGFDPAFANADCDLAALADAAITCGNKALSFCLHGIPGTGKSAFARWIAGRMGLEVIEKRGSDLLDMYVGNSEKNIARAFQEAADCDAFLIFDEVDSLLADRTGASKNWEVSQVNEMLTWMERHPLPFAATTNLMKGLDPAALRRFLFKAEFKPLLAEQAAALFAKTFGCVAPSGLRNLDLLTPGDVAVVARKARVLGETNPWVLFGALQTEVALKPGAGRVRVGF
jgi:transitional endoplasmic reticulum ATPase